MPLLSPSELILNTDGSIYHLHLRPEHIGDIMITVGDPDRVPLVSQYFDQVDYKIQKREFVTHTGQLRGKKISVISTGIGTDNIDIVLNELDALANIDLEKRTILTEKKSLKFIRIGTTGGLQAAYPVGTFVSSSHVIGLDNLLHFYPYTPNQEAQALQEAFSTQFSELPVSVYAGTANRQLLEDICKDWLQGITLTLPGFYAPQGRSLRLGTKLTTELIDEFQNFNFKGHQITNFEMETSALLCLAELLGHQAISCSVILANRQDGTFSKNTSEDVDRLIRKVLGSIE